jgi:hypothetical protein
MTKDIQIMLDGFVNHAFSIVEENLAKDCNVTKVTSAAMGIQESGENNFLAMLPWEDDESKVRMLNELGMLCYDEKLMSVALVNDAVMKQYAHKDVCETDKPITYPPDMRVDCVILCYINFKDPKENMFKAYPYKITEGKLIREEPLSFTGDTIAAMDSLIMNCVSFGFLKAAIFDQYQKKEIVDASFSKDVGDMLMQDVLKEYPGATLGNLPNFRGTNESH